MPHSAGFQYNGAIIITASHLPFNRNGFKFFTGEGGLEKGDIADLLARAAKSSAALRVHPAARHTDDAHLVATALQIQPDMLEQVGSAISEGSMQQSMWRSVQTLAGCQAVCS